LYVRCPKSSVISSSSKSPTNDYRTSSSLFIYYKHSQQPTSPSCNSQWGFYCSSTIIIIIAILLPYKPHCLTFLFLSPPIQVLIAFMLVAAAVASPIADKPAAADKSESVKDKRAIYGKSLYSLRRHCYYYYNYSYDGDITHLIYYSIMRLNISRLCHRSDYLFNSSQNRTNMIATVF